MDFSPVAPGLAAFEAAQLPANADAWRLVDPQTQIEAERVAQEDREREAAEAQTVANNHARWEAERISAAAALKEREALERAERAEQAERERAASQAQLLEWMAEDAARLAATEEASAARRKQDDDFYAFSVKIIFEIENSTRYGKNPCSDDDVSEWKFSEDEEENYSLIDSVVLQIADELAPWLTHYHSLGLIRDDGGKGPPRFSLIYHRRNEPLAPASLLTFPEKRVQIEVLSGATLVVSSSASPINATLLFEEARERPAAVGIWGGDLTPDLAPLADEKREEWLARMAMPATTISRTKERWKRSGGNLALYGLCGSRGERAVGDKPLEYLIPGVLPRGYVSLLLGDQQVGKTTLLGEIAAVIDSQCETERSVLGIPVEARGVSCIVSGEDGDDIIDRRNDSYSAVHGQSTSFVIDLRTTPWPAALELLWDLPHLDFLALDPLRLLLEGDEDSSEKVSCFFEQLEAFTVAKNCATLLAHHTGKKAPKGLSGMLAASRGSGVITQRPRAGLGMLRRGDGFAEVGLIKWNAPAEDAWAPVNVGTLFRKEQNMLLPVDARSPRAVASGSEPNSLELIHAAIVSENLIGNALRRTGKSELFERRLPDFVGMSRHTVREGVATLLAAGRVIDGPDGLMAVGGAQSAAGA